MTPSHELPPRITDGSGDDRARAADALGEAFPEHQRDGPPSHAAASAPPLRIGYVLLFTAWAAGYLVVLRYWLELAAPLGIAGDMTIALLAVEAAYVGPTLGTVYLWRGWRAQGFQFPVHGGEWLLVVFAGLALLETVGRLTLLRPGGEFGSRAAIFAVGLLAGFATIWAVMLWLAASQHRVPGRWRAFFGVKALVLMSFAVLDSALVPSLFELVTLLVVAVLDLRAPRRFPWTHWLGVAVCLLNGVVLLIQIGWAGGR